MGPGDFLLHYPKKNFLLISTGTKEFKKIKLICFSLSLNDSIKVNVSLIINKLPFILKFSF